MKHYLKSKCFDSQKWFWKCNLQYGSRFVPTLMCWYPKPRCGSMPKPPFQPCSMIYSVHFAHLMEFLVGGTKMDCGENLICSEKSVKASEITDTWLFFKGIYANNIENIRGACHWPFMIKNWSSHYSDIIISTMASQITGVSIVYSIICSAADQRKHQSSASLAFVRGIHRWPVNSPHKGPVTRKFFFHLMTSSAGIALVGYILIG